MLVYETYRDVLVRTAPGFGENRTMTSVSAPSSSTILKSPQFVAAREIVQKLHDSSYKAFLAGGCVRDLLLGRDPKDHDVTTSATPDIVLDMFPRTYAVGAHFGVVLVSKDVGDEVVVTEVATFRSDGVYSDGRHPDKVHYTMNPKEDVHRRDFTINGLLLDVDRLEAGDGQSVQLSSAVLDYVGGVADLEAGILRAIGDPILRFEEDHLRMLRAVRFAARLGFAIELGTLSAIRAFAPKVGLVSRERVRDELTRMLTEGHARRAFELLDSTGLLAHLLPEVIQLKGVEQPPEWHPEGDVWTHTLMLLDKLEAGCSMTLAWGALLHDIGKPATYQPPQFPGDRIRFNKHVEVGVRIGEEICRRLRFSNEETGQILALIENHMRFGDAPKMKESTLKRFFRLKDFPEHLALHRMDSLASSGNLELHQFAEERFRNMTAAEVMPNPLLTGDDLIAIGFRPGPSFKVMLHVVEEAQLNGHIRTKAQALDLIRGEFEGQPPGYVVKSA